MAWLIESAFLLGGLAVLLYYVEYRIGVGDNE